MTEISGQEADRALADVEARQRQVDAARTGHWWVHVLFAVLLGGGIAATGLDSPPVRVAVWALVGAVIVGGETASRRPQVAALLGMPARRRPGFSGRQVAATVLLILLVNVVPPLTRPDGTTDWTIEGVVTGLIYLVQALLIYPAVMRFSSWRR